MDSDYNHMNCKICDSRTKLLDVISKTKVLKCLKCGFVFFEKLPYEYDKYYVSRENFKHRKSEKIDYLNKILSKYVKHGDYFLDVGCGSGLAVKVANDLGAKGYGVDVNPVQINQGRVDLKLKTLIYGNIETVKLNKKFDVIFTNHTIEHVNNLDKMISRIKSLLKPSGKLVIICPNYSRLYPEEPISEGHLNYFNNKTMIMLLNNYGFKVVKNPIINDLKFDLYYQLNNLLNNKLNLFQVWLTFEKNE